MNDQDYQDFLDSKGELPSDDISHDILNIVRKDLNPSHFVILGKLVSIQIFVGLLTMLFCPQFNISLTNNYELFHFFHHTFGHYGCMAVCGAIFIGSGSLFASYILKLSEIQKIRNNKFLHLIALTGIGVSTFMIVGAKIYLETSIFWSAGAILGGLIMFEINRYARLKFLNF